MPGVSKATAASASSSTAPTPSCSADRPPARERADAARNRARVLAAAARLFAQAGLDHHRALADALLVPLAPDVFAHQRAGGLTRRTLAG
jgi:hypothetical protein